MLRIASHVIPDIYNEQLIAFDVRDTDVLAPQVLATKGPEVGTMAVSFQISAGRRLIRGETSLVRRYLLAAADCFSAMFLGTGVEGPVTYRFEGRAIEGPGMPEFYGAQTLNWLHAFCLASALRRQDVLQILDGYDRAKLKKAPTGSFDLYAIALVEGMRLFRRNDPGYVALLEEAERMSRPENLRIATPSVIGRFRALIPLVFSIARNDQAGFDKACEDAVKAHKAFYSRGKRKEDPDGLLAYHAAGIAAIGVDRGLVYNIDSEYTPRWLVYNEVP